MSDEIRDELPDDLNPAGFVGAYMFPDNSRRRWPGAIYLVARRAVSRRPRRVPRRCGRQRRLDRRCGDPGRRRRVLDHLRMADERRREGGAGRGAAGRRVSQSVTPRPSRCGGASGAVRPGGCCATRPRSPRRTVGSSSSTPSTVRSSNNSSNRTPTNLDPMFDGTFRKPVDKAVKPIGNALRKTGLTPDHLTIVGLLVGVGAGVAIGSGRLWLGALLVVLAGLPDLLDGALAKATDSSSQRGAFFDSTVDRITDFFLLGGIAWYFATGDFADELPMLPFAIAGVSSLISYKRAKAESLGHRGQGRADGACRADHRDPHRSGHQPVADPDPVADARADDDHGDPTVLEGVEAGSGRTGHAGAHRDAPLPSCQPTCGADRTTSHPRPASPPLMPEFPDAVTTNGYKLAALAARMTPGVLAAGLATPFGAGANFFSPERREMIERHLRRVDPTLRGLRLRRASQQAFDFYARYWIESFRLPTLSTAGRRPWLHRRRLPPDRRSASGGQRCHPRAAAPRRLGVGGPVDRRPGPRDHRGRRAPRPARAVRLVRRPALEARDARRAAGAEGGGVGDGGAARQPHRLSAVRPRPRPVRPRGRVLRRAHHVARRTSHCWRCGPGAPILPTAIYFTDRIDAHLGWVRPPMRVERQSKRLRDDVHRITQDLAGELEILIRRAPSQWHSSSRTGRLTPATATHRPDPELEERMAEIDRTIDCLAELTQSC